MNRTERLKRDNAVDPILFYDHKAEWGEFSNFSPHGIWLPSPWTFKPTYYKTSEHRFAAMKAVRVQDHDEVVQCPSPSEAKYLGRHIGLRADWGADINTVCWLVMVEALMAKVIQHDDVMHTLRITEQAWIYEDSSVDDIWGWRHGQDHSGKNLLGLAWMQVRGTLWPKVAGWVRL